MLKVKSEDKGIGFYQLYNHFDDEMAHYLVNAGSVGSL